MLELERWLGLDTDSDCSDDSEEDKLREIENSECATTDLICVADFHNSPDQNPYDDIDVEPTAATDRSPRDWSPPDPRAKDPLNRFLKYYFLSDSPKRVFWTRSRKKTPNPIILYSVTDHNEVHARAKRIRGLHTCSAGAPPNRVIVLGWNRLAVWRRASEFSAASYSEEVSRYIFNAALRFGRAMGGIRERPLLNKAENWADNALSGVLDHFQGSYLVRWKDVGGGWDVRAVLQLEVGMGPKKHILEATLKFLGVEERMLLAHSESALDAYVDGLQRVKEGGDGKGTVQKEAAPVPAERKESAEKEGDGRGEAAVNVEPGTRGQPPEQAERGTMENPLRAVPESEREMAADRGTINNPMRMSFIAELCYRIVGKEVMGCKGRLHWTADQTFTSFTGEGYLPYLNTRVEMEGFEY